MIVNEKVKVSVCVVTYNHEKFIKQCLQSLVDQVTDFNFEIIVADDCSTDSTPMLVAEFAELYPDKVRPFFHQKNLGAGKNYLFVHAQAAGEYIAHVDGDDYALPGKLQVQSDVLDRDTNCNIVFHRMKILFGNSGTLVDDLTDLNLVPKQGYTRAAILRHITVGAHSSKMYRARLRVKQYPQFDILDFYENVEQVGTGRACFPDGLPYGVYRAGIGVASAGGGTRRALAKTLLYFAKKYPENRKHINAAALLLFLADFKNRRPTSREFLLVWLKTFHVLSFYELATHWRITKMLRLPLSSGVL
jgi:glycosyltransferase involved in cell wall biosynthesis